VTELHDRKVVPLEIDHPIGERVGGCEIVWYLAGQPQVPEGGKELRCHLAPHVLDHRRHRERPCRRKTLQQMANAEEVVAVAVSDVDGRQVLAGRGDPVAQGLCLVGGHKRIDENGVALAADQRCGDWRPQASLGSGREIVSHGRHGRRDVYIPGELRGTIFHCWLFLYLWLVRLRSRVPREAYRQHRLIERYFPLDQAGHMLPSSLNPTSQPH
jgi:hypothetical protein